MKLESMPAKGKLVLAFVFGVIALATPLALGQTFSLVHTFTGGSDGAYPLNGLTASGKVLFGTTSSGGAFGYGVVFKVNALDQEIVLHAFGGGTAGENPKGR